ncbi:MAG: FtsX-like permease family protein [Clostridiales bacterium]|nr:FtsX-like permease family protein [Clostridiales bacterium]
MFFKLVYRNSVRSHKENALFMGSLIISIIAFYVVLSLSNQDVMRYLKTLESDAIRKLFSMITVLYGFTLFIIFALIYFASKYQIERRSHEFGVYIMMGMKRMKLLLMLLLEDISSSVIALLVGLPVSVLITEVISLLTVKAVGIGFMGHQSTWSLHAALLTAAGFLGVKILAFLILSFNLARKEVGTLLTDAPDNVRKKGYPLLHAVVQAVVLILGILLLIYAYDTGVSGTAWAGTRELGKTVVTGVLGTLLVFRGLRFVIDLIVRLVKSGKLHVFTFRQIEDTVIFKSGTLAICSLLILVASSCLAAGVATFASYDMYDKIRIDYTFTSFFKGDGSDPHKQIEEMGLAGEFLYLGELRIAHPYVVGDENYDSAFEADEYKRLLDELDPKFQYHNNWDDLGGFPFMICLSDYNKLAVAMGGEPLDLQEGELGLYRSESFAKGGNIDNQVLERRPRVTLVGKEYVMTGTVQNYPIVTDMFTTLSGAVIVPDADFDYFADGREEVYVNGILDRTKYTRSDMVENYTKLNKLFDLEGLEYESYLQNMGRQLFYLVAASYITIYLALIFLVVANTILGVQFLMGQKRTSRRYRTLVKLGADHPTLYKSSKKQINWYFGLPIAVAAASTFFATKALFNAILSSRTKTNIDEMLPVVLIVVVVFILIECLYMHIVKRSSSRFLETLMTPEREE